MSARFATKNVLLMLKALMVSAIMVVALNLSLGGFSSGEPRQLAKQSLKTQVEGKTLKVVDKSTTLNGMTITLKNPSQAQQTTRTPNPESPDNLAQLQLAKLDVAQVPDIPERIKPLTDVFVGHGQFESNIDLRFPIANLPDNASMGDVRLFAYVEALDVDGLFWSPVSIDTNYEGTIDAPIIVIELGGLDGMAFLGYTKP